MQRCKKPLAMAQISHLRKGTQTGELCSSLSPNVNLVSAAFSAPSLSWLLSALLWTCLKYHPEDPHTLNIPYMKTTSVYSFLMYHLLNSLLSHQTMYQMKLQITGYFLLHSQLLISYISCELSDFREGWKHDLYVLNVFSVIMHLLLFSREEKLPLGQRECRAESGTMWLTHPCAQKPTLGFSCCIGGCSSQKKEGERWHSFSETP